MSSEDIRAIKAALQVSTDVELAAALGIERSTIAQWKRRGSVPDKYFGVLNLDKNPKALTRFYNSFRARMFSRPEHHYFVRAALAFLPPQLDSPDDCLPADLGDAREEPFLSLMHLAQLRCLEIPGKPHPESHDDYFLLVTAMAEKDAETIAMIVGEIVPQST